MRYIHLLLPTALVAALAGAGGVHRVAMPAGAGDARTLAPAAATGPAAVAADSSVAGPTSGPAAAAMALDARDTLGGVGVSGEAAPGAFPAPSSAPDTSAAVWPPLGHDEAARNANRAAPESLAALRSALGPVDYLWVVRTALVQPASVDSVVERARRMGVRGLLVQVVGRGDAWYRSDLLPPPEALAFAPPDYDPLGRMLDRAHAAGLEVHAWMNCLLAWSAPRPPRDRRHVVHAHPEWFAMLPDGRRMTQLGPRALDRLGVEGAFLAPSHPRVREWVASIAAEIVTRYPVDGVHLDYIRCPDVETGYDPNTRARFAQVHGVDPQRFTFAPSPERWRLTRQLRAFQREQVTAMVREVRDSVLARRPGLALSAAVAADTVRAEGFLAQPWRAWVRDGLLDRVYPMCYSPEVPKVMSQLLLFRRELGADDRVVPGIAVFNTTPATAAVKIKGARALGYPLLALYSYDSLFAEDGRWALLERGLGTTLQRGPE